jgi:cysteine protease ATG4
VDHDEDGEEGAFFSDSPSPIPPSVTDSSSLDPVTPSISTGQHLDPMCDNGEFEQDVIVEDDDEDWVDPSPSPPSRINSRGVSRGQSSENKQGNDRATVRRGNASLHPPQHFPFPSSDDGEDSRPLSASSRPLRDRGETKPTPHLRSIRARDGGRTQSGGVKGVYVDSGDES